MNEQEKKELLIALCGYLPYRVICDRNMRYVELTSIDVSKGLIGIKSHECHVSLTFNIFRGVVKPYLRPMDSMTAEEKKHYRFLKGEMRLYDTLGTRLDNWLNEFKFDYRNLIGKGLALPAPDGMYDTYKYFPPEFKTYTEYVEHLKSKGLAFDAPDGK